MLPFPTDVDLALPDLPDVSKLLDFPRTFLDDIMSKNPLPDNIKQCILPSEPYFDSQCMADAFGIGTMMDFIEPIQSVAENMVPTLTDSISSIFDIAKCSQEINYTIPVRQIALDALGIDLGTSCDQEISICTGLDFDFDNIGEILHGLEKEFQPILDIVKNLTQPSYTDGTPNLEFDPSTSGLPIPNPLPIFTVIGALDIGTLTKAGWTGVKAFSRGTQIVSISTDTTAPTNSESQKSASKKVATDISVLSMNPRVEVKLELSYDWKSPESMFDHPNAEDWYQRLGMYHYFIDHLIYC